MSEPLVCAVLLTKDRPAMLARAMRAFRAQTYSNKSLLVFDTGPLAARPFAGLSIGELRNGANQLARAADIIIHFDDDDLSHPNRIAEQVAHLQSSGADVVGYDELLFWREPAPTDHGLAEYECDCERCIGEAWLYKNKLAKAGASFCYWRHVWESRPFPDLPRPERGGQGEDWEWAAGLNMARMSCFNPPDLDDSPRLICSIHGGNTSRGYDDLKESANWNRVPDWDDYCTERMKL